MSEPLPAGSATPIDPAAGEFGPSGSVPADVPSADGPGEFGPGRPGGGFDGPGPGDDPAEMRQHCYRLIREVTGRLGWRYRLFIPAAMLLSSVFLLPQWFLQFFTQRSQSLSQANASDFLLLLGAFGAGIALAEWLAIFFSGILHEWLRLTVSVGLRRDALASLNRTRIDQLDAGHRGDWMTRLTSDLRNCEFFLTDSLTDQIRQTTMLIGTFALFLHYSGAVAVLLLPTAAALLWFNMLVQRRMGPTLGEARMIEGDVFQSMIESFEGLRTIRSFGAEAFTISRLNVQLKSLFETGMKIMKSMSVLMGFNEFGSQLVITGVLTLAAYRISGNELTIENVLVYPFYINMFLGSAKSLAGAAYEWNRFFMEGGRLATLLYDETRQVQSHEQVFQTLENDVAQVRGMSASGLTLGYGDDPPVVDDFQFSLRAGEIVAMMGPSGCGKSTFLESFSGLRLPRAGEFQIAMADDSVRTFAQAPVFLSAFVEQQPYLFVGSVRDNVVMGNSRISDETIWRALEEVGLGIIIRERGGLDQVLSDRGRNLSVGQQYRLALCRALVSGRPFLLMDEPFAALDIDSVERVVEALHQERDRGAAVILITHVLPGSLETTRVVHLERRQPLPPPRSVTDRQFAPDH